MSDNLERAKKRAINALNTRAMSHGEMYARLIKLGEDEDTAETVADWCVKLGYIDDAEYARSLRRSLLRRGYGEKRIRGEFYKRRIPRELWEEILTASEIDGDDFSDSALKYIERKTRGELPGSDEKRRISAALSRRGFSWDEIKSAFNKYMELFDYE